MLSGAAAAAERTRAFARYSLVGALAGAVGSLAAGTPDWLAAQVPTITALKLMFVAYALLGVLGGIVYHGIAWAPRRERRVAAALGPSRHVIYKLAALFSIDAFAGGFVVQSLLALWLFERFDLSLTAASLFFFWAGVLAAFSYPAAAWLGARIGLVNTMVFTHLPASLCLIGAAFATSVEWRLRCFCAAPLWARWTCLRARPT